MTHAFGNVLVTGGAGFVGSQLVRALLPYSERVTVIDDLSTGKRAALPVSDKLVFLEADYVDERLLDRVLPGTDTLYHLACRNLVMSAEHMEEDFRVNLYGGFLLLRKTAEHCPALRRFVYTSTASVYGNARHFPTEEEEHRIELPYPASKFSTEHYVQVFHRMKGVPAVTLRLSNVFGPGQVATNPYCGVIAKFFAAMEQGEPFVIYGDGEQTRDYTYIGDALQALLLAGEHPAAPGKTFNVGTGIETSVNRLAEGILRLAEHPMPAPEYREKRRVDVVHRRCLDASAIRRELGWAAQTALDDGLRKTRLWIAGVEE